jgi:hypothetical protein
VTDEIYHTHTDSITKGKGFCQGLNERALVFLTCTLSLLGLSSIVEISEENKSENSRVRKTGP